MQFTTNEENDVPDLKAVNADELEQQLRDAAQRATASIAKLAEDAIADVRTVAHAQQQIGPLPATDLMLRSHVALVQDLELVSDLTALRLSVELTTVRAGTSYGGTLDAGQLSIPGGKYRLLVFLVDRELGKDAPELVSDEDQDQDRDE